MSHTSFWAKEIDFTPFMPQGNAAVPEKQATAARAKKEPLQQKARHMPGFSIICDFMMLNIANRTSAINPFFREDGEYLNLRRSPGRLPGTWVRARKTYVLTPKVLAAAFSIDVEPRLKRLQ